MSLEINAMGRASAPPASRQAADERRRQIREQQEKRRAELAEIEELKRQALAKDPDGLNRRALGIDGKGLQAFADVEHVTRIEKGRNVTYARRKPETVWARLGDQLGPDLANAGEKLTEIYAEMMGMAGSPEKDPGMPIARRDDPTNLPTRMLNASWQWGAIMGNFAPGSRFPAMFHGLCQDIMTPECGDATVITVSRPAAPRDPYAWYDNTPIIRSANVRNQPGRPKQSRWRAVVQSTCGEAERHAQATCVRLGCQELHAIMSYLGIFIG